MGSTVLKEHLAGIDQVELFVHVWRMDGAQERNLSQELQSEIVEMLDRCDLVVRQNAPVSLSVEVGVDLSLRPEDPEIAVLMTATLTEDVAVRRNLEIGREGDLVQALTWWNWLVRLSSLESLEDQVLDGALILIESFRDDVKAATLHAAERE